MLHLGFNPYPPRSILLLGAHSDDIEIGCGGTVLHLLQRYPEIHITWIVFSATGVRGEEARQSAELFLASAHQPRIVLRDFQDGYFPYIGGEIKDFFEGLKQETTPELIFTHYRHDLHQDHRLLCELTWNTWRDHFILEYEIPKYDGDLGNPNFYASLPTKVCEDKTTHLMNIFQTQANKHWFNRDTFMGLMRLRGMECRSHSGFAEAFYGRKLLLA